MSRTHDLRDRIEHLESIDGDGTELVTVTLPPDKSIRSVRERIASERAGAENIKSDRTRERVQRALDRVQRVLRGYGETPDTGLAVYAGVVDGDLVSAAFDDLPRPVTDSTYRCDDRFDLAPVEAAVAPSDTYGLVVVERGGAAVGRLVGDRVVPLQTLESQVMGKFRAGGQSAQRFARERERQRHEFFQQVGDVAAAEFLGDDAVTGLAVGGTLATAKTFVAGGYLDHRLQDRLLGTYSVEYATERGLRQLVERAESALLDAERRKSRDALEEFFSRLRDGETVAYGDGGLERAIEYGAVDTALVSSAVDGERRDELETAVSGQGGDSVVVSAETDRGARFTETFDGVGALLRFPVE